MPIFEKGHLPLESSSSATVRIHGVQVWGEDIPLCVLSFESLNIPIDLEISFVTRISVICQFTILCFKWLVKEHCVAKRFYWLFEGYFYMKIIVALILINSVTSLIFSLFYPFVWTKNKKHIFRWTDAHCTKNEVLH